MRSAARRRRGAADHPSHERWLVSYADLVTLLFALFVILYAMSQADIAKFRKAAESLRAAFGAPPLSAAKTEVSSRSTGPAAPAAEVDADSAELQELKDLLQETLILEVGASEFAEKIAMTVDGRGLVIRLTAKDAFDEGQVALKPDYQGLMDRIGRVLAKTRHSIRAEGHTAADEPRSAEFASSWEFSAARAAWLVRFWVQRIGIDPRRLSASGEAHYRPLVTADSEASAAERGKNRRVEIVVQKDRTP